MGGVNPESIVEDMKGLRSASDLKVSYFSKVPAITIHVYTYCQF